MQRLKEEIRLSSEETQMNCYMKKKYLLQLLIVLVVILQFVNIRPFSKTAEDVISRVPKDARYVCLVDFGRLSCNDRFYIYDVKANKYIYSSRVQHGNGGKSTALEPEISNIIGSNCSSVGLYKVTSLGKMNSWPNAECFRLKGLCSTNSNAEKRGILIHPSVSLSIIPKFPGLVIPLTSESRGCFAVSFLMMERLKECYKNGKIYVYAYK